MMRDIYLADIVDIPPGRMMLWTIMISLMNNVMTYYLPLIALSHIQPVTPSKTAALCSHDCRLTNNISQISATQPPPEVD